MKGYILVSRNQKNRNFTRSGIALLFLAGLTACGGSSDGGGAPVGNLPSQPQNVTVVRGDAQVTISWDNVSDATGYDICMATESITDPANCSVHENGEIVPDAPNPSQISTLINGVTYYFVVISKNVNGDGESSAQITAIPSGVVDPTPTGKLNDTGVTQCSDYAFDASNTLISGHTHSNNESCTNTTDAEGDSIPLGQDGHSGRDANAAVNDDSDGHKGFSFTKLDANGVALADQSSTSFSCVKDDITGLIWEVKTDDDGLHDKDDTYFWYNSDNNTNGGNAGTFQTYVGPENIATGGLSDVCQGYNPADSATYCNTESYVARVNTSKGGVGLCGATDWRLPIVEELRSIVNYGASNADFFPNRVGRYWSSQPSSGSSQHAWVLGVHVAKNSNQPVRLVRDGK